MDRLQRIARLHDSFARQGYREFAQGESEYGVPAALQTITEHYHLSTPTWSVLDLGCGPGNLKDFAQFKSYTGVDLSTEMLYEAGESGYQELVEANMADYVSNSALQHYDAVLALTCAYFLDPTAIRDFFINVDRLANHFWLITLDGLTKAATDVYRVEDGIDVYDHRGISLPWPDVHVTTIKGWRSLATEEDIMMDLVYRIK